MNFKELKVMVKNPRWAKRVKKLPILVNPETGEKIVVATLGMKHITEKQAKSLQKYLEEGSDKKLTLLNWDDHGTIKLYEKSSEGIHLRFKLVE
jgi:hypothetical protein